MKTVTPPALGAAPQAHVAPNLQIHRLSASDWPRYALGIGELLNHEITHSAYLYREEVFDREELERWLQTRTQPQGMLCVAILEGNLVGFASYAPFRSFSGSVDTVEHSLYVSQYWRTQGIGGKLLQASVHIAQQAGKKSLVGVIDSENLPSIRLHERHQFDHVGRLRGLGRKFGVYRNAELFQRLLS